jgi:hypothetical protein
MQRYILKKAADDRDDDDRRTDIMHPSEMSKPDWCGRADFYRITDTAKTKTVSPSFQLENVYDEGHRIHRKFQGWLHAMGILWGTWECDECGNRWSGVSPTECLDCASVKISYREVPLEDPYRMIAGHADGGVLDGGEWFDLDEPFLIEVKSIGPGTLRYDAPLLYQRYLDGLSLEELWQAVARPFGSHIRQGTLYCWLTKGMFRKIVFLYECKWNQQVKEFVVVPNFDHIKAILDVAQEVAQGVRAGIEPYRPPWAEPEHKTCKACPYRKKCWNESSQEAAAPAPTVIRAKSAARRKALRKA